ncbi:MAG: hypothetical protein HYV07_26260 [Deltaproteobacteria bacterium]|nr:hypothetical protein [Deltaproteobacteria bacterium]
MVTRNHAGPNHSPKAVPCGTGAHFIEALFAPSPGAFFELRAMHATTSAIASGYWALGSVAEALRWADSLSRSGWHVCIGVHPRLRDLGGEASRWSNVEGYGCLVLDLDDPASLEPAVTTLRGRGLEPSMAVSSGRGGHLYFLLDRVYPAASARPIARRLCELVRSDPVFDAPRVMRLPGTMNHKPGVNVLCELVYRSDPVRRYSLNEIADRLPTCGPGSPCSVRTGGVGGLCRTIGAQGGGGLGQDTSSALWSAKRRGELQQAAERLPAYIIDLIERGKQPGDRYPSRNEADLAVIRALVEAGFRDEEIVRVFEMNARGIRQRMAEKGVGSILRDIEKVRSTIAPGLAGEPTEIRVSKARGVHEGYARMHFEVLTGPFTGRTVQGGLKVGAEVWGHALAAFGREPCDPRELHGAHAHVLLREQEGRLEVGRWLQRS